MGFQLQQQSLTLSDLERQYTALSKWLKLESRGTPSNFATGLNTVKSESYRCVIVKNT